MLESGEEQGTQGEAIEILEKVRGGCGCLPNSRKVLASKKKKNSWEFSQKGNFLEGFVVNFVKFGISLSPSLWSLHCNTFFI